VPEPPRSAVKTGVRAKAQVRPQRGIARQRFRERQQVMHVEPGTPLVALARRELEASAPCQRYNRAAREKTERRRSRGHPLEVAHQRSLDLLAAFGVGPFEPFTEALVQRGRSDEQCLAHLDPGDYGPQARSQEDAIL